MGSVACAYLNPKTYAYWIVNDRLYDVDRGRKTIVNPKNKDTLSSPGRFGFLTEPVWSVLLILNFTINFSFPTACHFSLHQ